MDVEKLNLFNVPNNVVGLETIVVYTARDYNKKKKEISYILKSDSLHIGMD